MAYVESGARIGRDNRAVGSPAGKENLVNQVFSPPPQRRPETGLYATPISVTSITRSSNTATLTATAHGLALGDLFRIFGSNQAQYNSEFRVGAVTNANVITFTVFGSPTTPATGTMTIREVRTSKRDA